MPKMVSLYRSSPLLLRRARNHPNDSSAARLLRGETFHEQINQTATLCPARMPIPTIEQLVSVMASVGITDAKATFWADLLVDDLRRFDFRAFELLPLDYISGAMGLIEYQFGSTGYSIDRADSIHAPNFRPTEHGGTQLNRENLLLLARVSEIARSCAVDLWLNPDDDLKGKFTSPKQHLDTLNEFWWLSRWRSSWTKLEQSQPINLACGMDVDWRLHWDFGLGASLIVNLEVKRRAGGDVLRFAQGGEVEPHQLFDAGWAKSGKSKFRPSAENELNVLGLTLLGEIDHDVQARAGEWIKEQKDVDVLLLFSRFSQGHSGFDVHAVRKGELLDLVLKRELDTLDMCLHGRVATPLPFTINQLQFLP